MLLVPFLDLSPTPADRDGLMRACSRVISSGRYIGGSEVDAFERRTAEYLCAAHAIACSSGSDALVIALSALGVVRGDEVVVPAFSFFATVESVVRVGAVPRFVDIESDTLAADPTAVDAAINAKTRAVLAVHIAGTPARIEALRAITQARSVALIEDAAQAFGSRSGGRALGTFGELGGFSFQATKPLGALGDAGMVVTPDAELATRCRRLVVHGASGRHEHAEIGGNYRIDAIHAAMLSQKLASYESALSARERVARAYSEALGGLSGLTLPMLPAVGAGGELAADVRSNYALYTLRIEGAGRRDALARHLLARGVETSVYYPTPLYRQRALLDLGHGLEVGALPKTEQACRQALSLPIYPNLSPAQIDRVISAVREFSLAR